MARLPSFNAGDVVRALKRSGFVEDRQKESHLVPIHPESSARTVAPIHSGHPFKEPLLRANVRDAGLPVQEFPELL